MTKTDMPDVPIAIVHRPGQEPGITVPLSTFLGLLALARETVERAKADERQLATSTGAPVLPLADIETRDIDAARGRLEKGVRRAEESLASSNLEATLRKIKETQGSLVMSNLEATLRKITESLDTSSLEATLRKITESLEPFRENLADVVDPVALKEARELDEDLADCIALEEARRRDEETVPHELVKRLMAGEHPMKVYREHRGLTQAALAERTGLSAMYLSQIETGRRGGSTKTLRKIARALNVDLDDLARWDEDDEAGSEAPPAWLVKRAIPKAKPTTKTRSRRDLDLSGKAEPIKPRAKSRKRSRRDLDLDG